MRYFEESLVLQRCSAAIGPSEERSVAVLGSGDYSVQLSEDRRPLLSIINGHHGGHDIASTVDCRGKVAYIPPPNIIFKKSIRGIRERELRKLTIDKGYSSALVIGKREASQVTIGELKGKTSSNPRATLKGGFPKYGVIYENRLVEFSRKGTVTQQEYDGHIIMLGMSRQGLYKLMKQLGGPPIQSLVREGLVPDAGKPTIIVTNGWLTSSDLEAIKGLNNIVLAYCGLAPLEKGLGGGLPLHEIVRDEELRYRTMLATCDSDLEKWYTHSLAFVTIASLFSRYYSWSAKPLPEEILGLMYNGYRLIRQEFFPVLLYNDYNLGRISVQGGSLIEYIDTHTPSTQDFYIIKATGSPSKWPGDLL